MDNWKTSGLLLSIIIITPLLLFIVTTLIKNRSFNLAIAMELNHKSLMKQKWFQLFSLAGAFYTVSFLGIAMHEKPIELSSAGLNRFIADGQLPIGILSATAVLTLIIARIHASFQVETQIKKLEEKNNIDIYFILKKETTNNINHALKTLNIKRSTFIKEIEINQNLYNKFFTGKPHEGIPSINEDTFIKMKKSIDIIKIEFIEFMEKTKKTNIHVTTRSLKNSLNNFYKIINIDFYELIGEEGSFINIKEIKLLTVSEFSSTYITTVKIYKSILDSCIEYESKDINTKINIDLNDELKFLSSKILADKFHIVSTIIDKAKEKQIYYNSPE